MVNIPFSQLKADSPLNLGDKNITSVDELILTEVGNSSPTQKSVKLKVNADGALVVVGAATEVVLYNPVSESINNSILPTSLQSLSNVPIPTVSDNNKILKVLNNGTSTTYVWDTLGSANFISVNGQGSYNNINFDGFLAVISGSSITIRPQGGGTTSTGGSGFTITGQESPYQINTRSVANPSLIKFSGNFTTTVDGGNITIDNSIAVTGNVTGGDKVIGFRIGTGLTGVVANDKYLDITADAVTGGGTGLTSIGAGGNVTGGTSFTSLNLGSNVSGVISAGVLTLNVTGSASINYSSLTETFAESSTHRVVAEGTGTNSVKFRRIRARAGGALQIDVVAESNSTGGASKYLQVGIAPANTAGYVLTWTGSAWTAQPPNASGVSKITAGTGITVSSAGNGEYVISASGSGSGGNSSGQFTNVLVSGLSATLICEGITSTVILAVQGEARFKGPVNIESNIIRTSYGADTPITELVGLKRTSALFYSFSMQYQDSAPNNLMSPGDMALVRQGGATYLALKKAEGSFAFFKAFYEV